MYIWVFLNYYIIEIWFWACKWKKGVYILYIYMYLFYGYEDDFLVRLLFFKIVDILRGKVEGNSCCRGG